MFEAHCCDFNTGKDLPAIVERLSGIFAPSPTFNPQIAADYFRNATAEPLRCFVLASAALKRAINKGYAPQVTLA